MNDTTRDTCDMRCLPEVVAATARTGVTADQVRPVSFTCGVTGEAAVAIIIGDRVAARLLAEAQGALDTLVAAQSLASLAQATLCVCDVATLVDQPQPVVEQVLRGIVARGLVIEETIHDMPYFDLTATGRSLVEQALGAGSYAMGETEARDS